MIRMWIYGVTSGVVTSLLLSLFLKFCKIKLLVLRMSQCTLLLMNKVIGM